MSPENRSRRKFISASTMAMGAWAVTLTGRAGQDNSAEWVGELEMALQRFSKRVQSKGGNDGTIEMLCTMPDASAFGSAPGNLAGLGYQAKSAGNHITISREGMTVRIILQHGGGVRSAYPTLS